MAEHVSPRDVVETIPFTESPDAGHGRHRYTRSRSLTVRYIVPAWAPGLQVTRSRSCGARPSSILLMRDASSIHNMFHVSIEDAARCSQEAAEALVAAEADVEAAEAHAAWCSREAAEALAYQCSREADVDALEWKLMLK